MINPSYVWRSIMSAQELICQGSYKRISSGHQMKIWGDPWLPDADHHFIVSDFIPEFQIKM